MKKLFSVAVMIAFSLFLSQAASAAPAKQATPKTPGVEEFLRSLQSQDGAPAPAVRSCYGDCLRTYYWPCVSSCGGDPNCEAVNCDPIFEGCSCECNGGVCP